jgi:hypothetical protein
MGFNSAFKGLSKGNVLNHSLQWDLWAPGPFWTGMEKRQSLDPTGIRTPDCPFLSESPFAAQFVKFPSIYNTLVFSVVTVSSDGGNSLETRQEI